VKGQTIGESYEITGILGWGGMGVVYEAHDHLLVRNVAIKAPLLDEYAPTLRKEAQAMAAVHHPNLVTIHSIGHQDGVEFIVMERVYGMTLEDRIREAWDSGRPMPVDEAIDLLIAITDAITAVHRAGAAHRDIKAANVMLSGQRVVLTDFGLVTPEVAVHAGGPIAGSAEYMAPELIMGVVKPGRGLQLDLYALGVLAFELLGGRRPFSADNVHAVLAAHVQKPAPDLRTYRSDVPDDLVGLVAELLAKSPEERPESAEAVLWRLTAIKAELPVASRPPSMSLLIVDDDPEVGAVLKRNLQWALPRLAVEVETDPLSALERIGKRKIDIAVIDLNMPRMNGVELAMSIRALPRRSQPLLVAMSAEAKESDVAVLRSLGLYEFVPKDEGFVPRMCDLIGDVRRARYTTEPPRRRGSRPRI
jgi:serine/threonine-protein kinase